MFIMCASCLEALPFHLLQRHPAPQATFRSRMTAATFARASRRFGLRSFAIDNAPARGWQTMVVEP